MDKGNIVKSNTSGKDGLLLAITRDGKRGKVKVFGRDEEVWRPLDSMTVTTSGNETCWKCGGSGIYQGGGMVLNGRFTGYTGECYACAGKGVQNNEDRIRNHYYWHRQAVIDVAVAEAERGEFESLERTAENMAERGSKGTIDSEGFTPPVKPAAKPKVKIRSKKKAPAKPASHVGRATPLDGEVIDCKKCGSTHRNDIPCF